MNSKPQEPQNGSDYYKHKLPCGPPPSGRPSSSCAMGCEDARLFYKFTHCLSYVWLENKREFWIYPTHFTRNSVYGYVWNGHIWREYSFKRKLMKTYY